MTNRKNGFTIVELVIVIAVIAILAAVLIPTFSTVIETAQESIAMQYASAAYQLVAMEVGKTGRENMSDSDFLIISGHYLYRIDPDVGFVDYKTDVVHADKKAAFAYALGEFADTPKLHYFAGQKDVKALGFTEAVIADADITVNTDITSDVIVIKGKLK